jgi:hypothetical protein
MCEKCEANRTRNTAIKRGATDALFAEPVAGSPAERALAEVPGFSAFLEIGRRLEAITRLAADDARDAAEKQAATALITSMTPEGRTDAIRVARYIADICEGVYKNVAVAKITLKDADGTNVAVVLEDGAIVVRVNGEEVSRSELAPDADPDAALDAAERAMQAHREHYS